MLLIPAAFLFVVSLALFCLVGIVLMIVLKILAGVLWVIIKLIEHDSRNAANDFPSFDHLVSPGDQCRRYIETNRLSGFQVDREY
jgi:hypothetical protein